MRGGTRGAVKEEDPVEEGGVWPLCRGVVAGLDEGGVCDCIWPKRYLGEAAAM